uniref:polynucleotide adenylyltransferase n=1 Tax=Astyanax mexicanus TaxID=7994 RepID=A0A8B9H3L3_ASTMX
MFTQPSLARAFVQQQIESQLNFTNRNFHSHHLNGFPLIPTYQWKPPLDVPYTSPNGSKNKNRKRKSDGSTQDDQKRQRVRSPKPYEPPGKVSSFSPVHRGEQGPSRRAVDETCSPVHSPMHTPGTSKPVGCVPSLREESYQNAYSGFPPSIVKDKLSQQILDLFLACEQQNEDLQKKESCRAQLQWDIQLLHPCARVFLAGSSLNGFGSRSSDADLCLVVQDGPVNQRTDAVYILSRVQRLLYKLSYIERPQLIRAKVPILKFRDRISQSVGSCAREHCTCAVGLNTMHCCLCFRWDKFVISVREGKALPRPNSWEWKNKFICVEEPFDGTNTARAVHEKMKFDAIKAQFTESWQVLQVRKDLDYILPIRETKPKR